MKSVVFVSGAYNSSSIFWTLINIWKARRVARRLWKQGYAVICPHTNSGLFGNKNMKQEFLEGYLEIVDRLDPGKDKLFMLQNWRKSSGANAEFARAKERNIKVEFSA